MDTSQSHNRSGPESHYSPALLAIAAGIGTSYEESYRRGRMPNSNPPNSNLLTGGPEEDIRCSICLDPFCDRAKVMPCGHFFDLSCIRLWLDQRRKASRHCPMCRAEMTELHHAFDGHGGFTSQIFEPLDPESPLEDDSEDDETILPDMTDRETYRVTELRRLRALPLWSNQWRASYLNICVKEGSFYISVKRNVNLQIKQHGLETISRLVRVLDVEKIHHSWPNYSPPPVNTDRESLWALEEARAESCLLFSRLTGTDYNSREVKVDFYSEEIYSGDRGLHGLVTKRVKLQRYRRLPGSYTIMWEISLCEEGPASADGDIQQIDADGESLDFLRAQMEIRETREQIQGTLEWFRRRESLDQWHELERGTTNLAEPYLGGTSCSFCGHFHRNGDCSLPWT